MMLAMKLIVADVADVADVSNDVHADPWLTVSLVILTPNEG